MDTSKTKGSSLRGTRTAWLCMALALLVSCSSGGSDGRAAAAASGGSSTTSTSTSTTSTTAPEPKNLVDLADTKLSDAGIAEDFKVETTGDLINLVAAWCFSPEEDLRQRVYERSIGRVGPDNTRSQEDWSRRHYLLASITAGLLCPNSRTAIRRAAAAEGFQVVPEFDVPSALNEERARTFLEASTYRAQLDDDDFPDCDLPDGLTERFSYTLVENRGPDVWVFKDGEGNVLDVVVSVGQITGPNGYDGPLPWPYNSCDPMIFKSSAQARADSTGD